MRILITGASGFIGNNICNYLLDNLQEVIGVNQKTSYINNIKNPLYSEFIIDISSINEIENLGNLISNVDVIIHAAASLNMQTYNNQVIRVNCIGTQNILWLASKLKVKKFLFISSVPIIGIPVNLPIKETHTIYPKTTYHLSKYFGEQLVMLSSSNEMDYFILRITAPVGIGMPKSRLLSVMLQNCLNNEPLLLSGSGTRRQNYIDVRDIVRATLLCINSDKSGIYNIAGSKTISNSELAQLCVQKCKSNSIIKYNINKDFEEGVVWDVSIEKAKLNLGFIPLFNIANTIDNILTNK